MAEPTTILTVCTGNICRSPAMALLLAASLEACDDLLVTSGGISALVDHPIADPMGTLLAGVGVNSAEFRSHQLTADDIRGADIIVTATRAHRSTVAREDPSAVPRTFTLRELARLASYVPPSGLTGSTPAQRLHSLAIEAPRYRGLIPAVTADDDDIDDPWDRPVEAYRRAFDSIFTSTLAIVDAITR